MANGDRVRMAFGFDGIVENNELVLNEGDIVTLVDVEVGEGWWEGQTENGKIGLFPSGYAEKIEADYAAVHHQPNPSTTDLLGDFDPPQSYQNTDQPLESYTKSDDEWEDNWGQAYEPPVPQTQTTPPASLPVRSGSTTTTKSEADSPKKSSKSSLFGGINLFSSLTNNQAESFILGEVKANTTGKPRISFMLTEDGAMWEGTAQQFTCSISDPQKASKFSGFKSYITYNITPSHTNKTVSRRYKHFDWLFEQLTKKFNVVIAIPPLPDKQLTGRYEEEFIESRMRQLQGWLARMSIHPVVSHSEVLQHFLVSKDSEKAWKEGKRKAESDTAVGGTFCMTIEPANQSMELSKAEQNVAHYSQFTKSMDEALKQTIAHGSEYARKCSGPLMREYQKMGQCFKSLGDSFALDNRAVAIPLTEAIKHTGQTYEDIGTLFQEQSKYDWNPLLEGFSEYKGLMACFPNILGNNKSAIEKQREMVKLQGEGKYTADDVENARTRAETLSYAVQAEMNHIQHYRVGDFTNYMKTFVEQQITFYQSIVSKLQETAQKYEGLNS